ncbi:MAG: transcriptional regulator [Bacteroidetes bacterium]|nr:transcriptional regulator [Bacteroidota bacterium]
MHQLHIQQDIQLMYVQATSFPQGIMDAFNKLKNLLPDADNRTYYGISYPVNGSIVYKAATEELSGEEAQQYGCELFIARAGNYIAELLHDWKKDETAIGKTFQLLLAHPGIDLKGACIEKYTDDDVLCMVRLADLED